MKRVLLAVAGILLAAGCSSGPSAATRAHQQAVQACQEASSGGVSSAMALVHAHQAAGLDASYSALATAIGQVAVTQQAFGADLGAEGGATDGTSALQAVSTDCAQLGITVSATAPQTANPLGGLGG